MTLFCGMKISFALVATLTAACATNRVPAFVAATNQTVETGTEMSLSGDAQVVWVYNHSTVPIMVTGLHLVECENIHNRCEVQRVRVEVPAGTRVNIATVRPENAGRPYSFRYNYSWEAVRERANE